MVEEKPKPDYMKQFVEYRDKAMDLEDILDRTMKGPTSDERAAFREQYEAILAAARPDFDFGNDEKLKKDNYQAIIDQNEGYANDTLSRNLDGIVKGLDKKVLDNLIAMNSEKKPTVVGTQEVDGDIIKRYSIMQQATNRVKAFENGELEGKALEEVRMEVAKMYARQYIENLKVDDKKKGLLKDDQWYVEHENLTYVGAIKHMKDEKFEKLATGLLKKSASLAKGEYDAFTGEKKRDVYDIVRDSIKYFAQQGGKQFETAAENLYVAYKSVKK